MHSHQTAARHIAHKALVITAAAAILTACTTSREIAGAVSGRPYVPTAEDRAKIAANSTFQLRPAAQGKAVVYIYRNSQFLGGGRDYEIFLDDKSVGILPNGSYRRLELASATYKIRVQFATWAAQSEPSRGELTLAPDETAIIRLNVAARPIAEVARYKGGVQGATSGLWMSDTRLQIMTNTEGVFDLSRIEPAKP